jgi:hypothetical protein
MKINTRFYLPQWNTSLHPWNAMSEKATSLLLNIYKAAPSFASYYALFRQNPDKEQLYSSLKNDVNAVLPFAFLANSDFLFYKTYFKSNLLEIIFKHKAELSSRTCKMIQTAFLNRMEYTQQRLDKNFRERLFSEFEELVPVDLNRMKKSGILNDQPIQAFVDHCMQTQKKPENELDTFGYKLAPNETFLRSVHTEYALQQLRQIDFRKEHPMAKELVHKNAFNWSYQKEELLGHEIIRTILTEVASVEIDKSWVQMILAFASDPRTSKNSRSYIKWWSKIEPKLIDKFLKILSHGEILLFLDALSGFANKKDSTMLRMFESRKQLLIGLSLQNKIEKSRLFFPSQVMKYLKAEKPHLDLSFVCNLVGTQNTCIIYLKVGGLHIFEGSHSCRLRIYEDYPVNYDILDPRLKERQYRDLTTGMEEEYYAEFLKNPYSMTHHPNGNWKKQAIKLLKSYIEFEVDRLLTNKEIGAFRYD